MRRKITYDAEAARGYIVDHKFKVVARAEQVSHKTSLRAFREWMNALSSDYVLVTMTKVDSVSAKNLETVVFARVDLRWPWAKLNVRAA